MGGAPGGVLPPGPSGPPKKPKDVQLAEDLLAINGIASGHDRALRLLAVWNMERKEGVKI